jgi:hypothetical protein
MVLAVAVLYINGSEVCCGKFSALLHFVSFYLFLQTTDSMEFGRRFKRCVCTRNFVFFDIHYGRRHFLLCGLLTDCTC